jgi:hypothetical protein
LRKEFSASHPLHQNSANRIIALKFSGLRSDFRSFPQGFPLLCAKLNIAEIFFCCAGAKAVPLPPEKYSSAIF